jgi:hypothetical protein
MHGCGGHDSQLVIMCRDRPDILQSAKGISNLVPFAIHFAVEAKLLLPIASVREVIVLCVRWYLPFKLSYRDLVEMMAERGLSMAYATIMRWVNHMPRSLSAAGIDLHGGRALVACR